VDNKKLPRYLTMKDFRENIVNWSDDTIRRRIQEGMPAMQDTASGRYVFPTQEVMDWFKRRLVRTG